MSLKIIAHANIPYMTINDPLLSDLQRMKNVSRESRIMPLHQSPSAYVKVLGLQDYVMQR